MLLTTNRVRDFDDAIQSRIHLALRYSPLGVDTRKGIWNTFLQNAITAEGKADYSDDNLNDLAKHNLNGRQVGTCFVEVMSSYADRFLLLDQECRPGSACFGVPGKGCDVIFSLRNRH
jgi:hypothetical protein